MLNISQQVAQREIKQWVTADDKYLVLNAPSGYGKSYLLDDTLAKLPKYNQRRKLFNKTPIYATHMTASTNKASSVLAEGITVQKLFKLRPRFNFDTGGMVLSETSGTVPIYDALIVVDECGPIDRRLKNLIDTLTVRTKVLYVGDDCQLKPINETTSPIFDSGFKTISLDIPERQDPNSDLFKLCVQLRRIVKTGVWEKLHTGVGITHTNAQQAKDTFASWFVGTHPINMSKAITYTNKRAIDFNRYVRTIRNTPTDWTVGDIVAVSGYCVDVNNAHPVRSEEVFTILNVSTTPQDYRGLVFFRVTLSNGYTYRIPASPSAWRSALDVTANIPDWNTHYYLKNNFIDLRDGSACTAHVSQGSTYDRVYIDLNDMARCQDLDTLARLLYVAVSRAREEVVFNGYLPPHLFI